MLSACSTVEPPCAASPFKSMLCTLLRLRLVFEMSVRETVPEEIRRVTADRNEAFAPLTGNLSLHEPDLDLLCFAVLAARLDDVTYRNSLSAGRQVTPSESDRPLSSRFMRNPLV